MKPEILTRISDLIDSFFDGTTSPAEEAELEELIKGADSLPVHLRNDCEAFLLCRASSRIAPPDDLRKRLEAAIENRANAEILAKAKSLLKFRSFAALAAAAVVTIAFFIPFSRPDGQTIHVDEQPRQIAENNPESMVEAIPTKPVIETPRATPTRIVDDPQEAASYLAKAFNKLSKSRQTTDKGLAHCNRQLNRVARILNAASQERPTEEASPA